MGNERVEARNVTMYPSQWQVVDKMAAEVARLTGGKAETSAGLRLVVERFRELSEARPVEAAREGCDERRGG